jgi:hypothetical protein
MIAVANGRRLSAREEKALEQTRRVCFQPALIGEGRMVALPLAAKGTESASHMIPKSAIIAPTKPEMT